MKTHQTNEETIIALATPPGVGAIAVLRLSGAEAISIVARHFKGKALLAQASHTVHFGQIVDEHRELLDEVVVTLYRAPRSYTKEDVVEISCHGSLYLQQRLLSLFLQAGARLAEPGEFTLRAFKNGRFSLDRAEAVADVIAAESASAHRLALQQMRSGISQKLVSLRSELLRLAALVELELDFGEEDVEFAPRPELSALVQQLRQEIQSLLLSFQLGNAIKTGILTVIAGRPNAGKSTLFNLLLQDERAIVSPMPGTTRDTLEEVLNVQGLSFRLVDTAGIREAQDQIEQIGIQRTLQKVEQAALLLYVFDCATLSEAEVRSDLQALARQQLPLLVIANKTDQASLEQLQQLPPDWLPVSAIAAEDNSVELQRLTQTMLQRTVGNQLLEDSSIISNTRHAEALKQADQALARVTEVLVSQLPTDLLALDLRHALQHIGRITGEVDVEELLGFIFSKFCIGK